MDENVEICRSKLKVSRDPMSHRIIEKRRRDRMNSCLADLSRLIPATYLKKGRGRIEKTEIIELAIKHLKQLQSMIYNRKIDPTVELEGSQKEFASKEQFYLGYQECLHETTCYLVESEGLLLGDPLCSRLLSHLQKHGESICSKGHFGDGNALLHRNSSMRSPEFNCNSVGSFADADGGDSQPFAIKKSPPSPLRYVSTPTIEVDSSAYECSEEFDLRRIQNAALNNVVNHQKLESNYRWQPPAELLDTNQLRTNSNDSDVDPLHNLGGMSTCSRSSNRSDEVYKYKTNIKERFHADQKIKSDSDGDENDDLEDVTRRTSLASSSCSTQHLPQKRKLVEDSDSLSHQQFKKNLQEKQRLCNNRELENDKVRLPAIPIFALHPKGSYYIPMAIESSLIMPQLNALSNFPVALHQIGISVSFNHELMGNNLVDMRTK
ncbi:hypothetical protein CHUAL_005176 [Chamberlinius hualienensis]